MEGYFTILSAIAELEADYISERTKRNINFKRKWCSVGNKGLDERTINKIKKLYVETDLTQRNCRKM